MSGLPITVNLSAYRGDTWSQTFRFLSGDQPADLTGATIASEARRGDTSTALDVEVDTSTGEITLRLPEASLPPATYDYDVELTDADDTVTTWVRGRLTVERDVTNELP